LEGSIININNRGATWDSLIVNLGSDDIYPDRLLFLNKTTAFLTANDYYSSGDNYFIFKSEDGGNSWNQVYSHYFNNSQFLFFSDSLNGYALGAYFISQFD
jgi:photosystem II stability/assembly factor-like uncharacterized protein